MSASREETPQAVRAVCECGWRSGAWVIGTGRNAEWLARGHAAEEYRRHHHRHHTPDPTFTTAEWPS